MRCYGRLGKCAYLLEKKKTWLRPWINEHLKIRRIMYIEGITRWREDVNFIFQFQTQVGFSFCQVNITLISSRQSVISSMFIIYLRFDVFIYMLNMVYVWQFFLTVRTCWNSLYTSKNWITTSLNRNLHMNWKVF